MPVAAVLFLVSILSTFGLAELIGRSDTVRGALGSALCPSGWTLAVGGTSTARTSTIRRGVSSGFSASCVSPAGESDYCEACGLVAGSPFLLFVAAAGTSFLWSLRKKPSALDHLAQLDAALGLGALSREQYDELRRDVLGNPDMTRERFQAALRRGRSG